MNDDNQVSKKPTRREAISELWKRGIVWHKLNETQKQLYDLVAETDKRIIVWLCSRRLGKTYSLCVMAIEKCIKEKNSVVKYLCPDQKQAKNIVIPIIREILEDCPKGLRPEYLKNDGKYVFPNGSELQLSGNDSNRAESLRGGFAHLCIIDEAGFCDNLKYNVQSILLPTVTTTGGKVVLSSTPPKTPGHEFNHFIRRAKNDGTFIKKTIFQNSRFTPAQVQEIIDTYELGIEDPEFRREYLCELSINIEDAIVPEFTESLKVEIVQEWKRPPFFDYYLSADIGFKDFTAVLFAYYDFLADKLIIEDEIVINKMTTETLANLIKTKEQKILYEPTTNEQRIPYLRVSDNNLFVINDLQKLHGITFIPTSKDDKETAINEMRIRINSRKIIINPRCTTLIKHLEEGTWAKSLSKTRSFDRSSDNGHFDTLDALVYLIRNVQWSKNPYPAGWNLPSRENRFEYKDKKQNDAYEKIASLFKFKKSL